MPPLSMTGLPTYFVIDMSILSIPGAMIISVCGARVPRVPPSPIGSSVADDQAVGCAGSGGGGTCRRPAVRH